MSRWCQGRYVPSYSGKYARKGLRRIFSLNLSILFNNRTMLVLINHVELQILSNSVRASCNLFTVASSNSIWSYSEIATTKSTAVTFSKQCIHFFLSDLCPPTSSTRYVSCWTAKVVSVMPVLFILNRRTSSSFGRYSGAAMRSIASK